MDFTVLIFRTHYPGAWSGNLLYKYSRFSFCNGSFYNSLLWLLSIWTEHSRLVVHYCRNSSTLSLLNCASNSFPLCMCFLFFYFSTVLLRWLWFFHPWCPSKRQKWRKNQNIWLKFLPDVFCTTAWVFFNKITSDLIDIFSIIYVFFYIPNLLN
jgi:hypothetical protein